MTRLQSATEYHLQTAYHRQTMAGGRMDWSNQPDPYKHYPGADQIPLPRDLVFPKASVQAVLSGTYRRPAQTLDLGLLSHLFFMAYGFTSQVQHGADMFLYRSAPSAGALYPTEAYLAARDVPGLEDGLYHYSILDFALTRLRKGPPPKGIPSPAVILTGLYFRSAWKYADRAFRYCLFDTGHVAENFMLAAPALGLEAHCTFDFDDSLLNRYLGLDPARETALAMVSLDDASDRDSGDGPLDETVPPSAPVAGREEIFDAIVQAAALTSAPLATPENPESILWPGTEQISLPSPEWDAFESPTLGQIVRQRRSRRNFRPENPGRTDLARLMDLMVIPGTGSQVNLSVIVNAVRDLRDGLYLCLDSRRIQPHTRGFVSPMIGDAALSQDWVGRANTIFLLSAPLAGLEQTRGPRSYRHACLTAGRIGQRGYLAAEALGWGCCGVGAFFDEDLSRILGLPASENPLYVLPVGPVKKRTHGGRNDPI